MQCISTFGEDTTNETVATFTQFQTLVQQLPEHAWTQYDARQLRFKVHSHTQTIPFVFEDHCGRQEFPNNLEWATVYLDQFVARLQAHFGLEEPYVYKAMLARLPPGAAIAPHKDSSFILQQVHRLHLPVLTSPDVHFSVGEHMYHLEEGCWYELDNCQTHGVENRSTTTACVHLIVDLAEPGIHPLRFAHISKTGGIAVANIDRTLCWGIHDPFFNSIADRGRFHTVPHTVVGYKALREIAQYFTVVRHPYDRIVSEYYCGVQGVQNGREDVSAFNQYIQSKLRKPQRLLHYIPQTDYTHDSQDVQIIPHIVRFSHLVSDVNALLVRHKYPKHIRMSSNRVNQAPCFKRFGPTDFTTETKQLIDTYYARDFRLLSTYF